MKNWLIKQEIFNNFKGFFYWEIKFEEGNLSSSNIIDLIESVDFASDFFKEPLKDWEYVETHFLSIKFLAKIK